MADGSICSRREQRFYRHCPRYKGRCASASAGAAICKNFWCASGAYHCRESASASPTLRCARFGPTPSYAEKSAIQNRIAYLYNQHVAPQSRTYQEGEVSHVKMRARTRLLAAPCTAGTRRRSSRPGPMLSKPATAMRPWARSAASRRTRFSSASYRRPTSRRSCARPTRMSSSGISGTRTRRSGRRCARSVRAGGRGHLHLHRRSKVWR